MNLSQVPALHMDRANNSKKRGRLGHPEPTGRPPESPNQPSTKEVTLSLHRPEEASAIEAFDKGRAEEVAAIYFAACHGKEMRAVRSKFLKAFSTKAARAVKRGDDEKAWKIYD